MLNPIPAYVLRNSKGKYPFIPLVKIQATYNIRFAVIIIVTIRKGFAQYRWNIPTYLPLYYWSHRRFRREPGSRESEETDGAEFIVIFRWLYAHER